jgi:hypothetical protein
MHDNNPKAGNLSPQSTMSFFPTVYSPKTRPSFNPYKLSMKEELMNSTLGNTVYFAPKTVRAKKLSPIRQPRNSLHNLDTKLSAAGL